MNNPVQEMIAIQQLNRKFKYAVEHNTVLSWTEYVNRFKDDGKTFEERDECFIYIDNEESGYEPGMIVAMSLVDQEHRDIISVWGTDKDASGYPKLLIEHEYDEESEFYNKGFVHMILEYVSKTPHDYCDIFEICPQVDLNTETGKFVWADF